MSIPWESQTFQAKTLALDPNQPPVSDRQDRLAERFTEAVRAVRLLVIGAGGLGSEVVTGAARKGYGVIAIADRDVVEPHNLSRQFFGEADLYEMKAICLARNAVAHSFLGSTCIGHAADFTPETAPVLMEGATLGICGVDNNDCRYHAARLFRQAGVPLISLAVDEAAMSGWVFVQETGGPCLGCMFPRMSRPSTQKQQCRPVPSTLNPLRMLAGVVLHAADSLVTARERRWNFFSINLGGGRPVFAQEKSRPACALCDPNAKESNNAAG